MKRQASPVSSVEVEQIHPKLFTTKRTRVHTTQKNDLPRINTSSVKEVLKSRILSLNMDDSEAENDNAVIVADIGEIYRQHLRWKAHLPRVKPFYGKLSNVRN